MNKKHTSALENGLIWFGAALSIAEIMTGTYMAPLGFKKGFLAVLLGHIIGCMMLFLAGLIGGKTRKCAMDTVKSDFGYHGAVFFAILNIVQLIGWTAIMIYDGALAANSIFAIGNSLWCIIIGLLIAVWIIIGIKNLGKLNLVAMSALFILTIVLSFLIFKNNVANSVGNSSITFGAAVELSVAMPLSWLPLISDYTSVSEKPTKATAVSACTYGIVSCWMYLIGMGAAIFTAESDIAQIMLKSGLSTAGLIIIVFSTTTTTFLDAYSAGISASAISQKIRSKWFALAVTIIGTISAIGFPITDITDFLYFIGSVFAPMIAIQIADFYILKRNHASLKYSFKNFFIWLIGFIVYRLLMRTDIFVGSTFLSVIITTGICIIVNRIEKRIQREI